MHSIGLVVAAAVAVGCVGGSQKKGPISVTGGSLTETKGAEQTGFVNAAVQALSGITYNSQASAGIILVLIAAFVTAILISSMQFMVIVLMIVSSHRREMARIKRWPAHPARGE